MTFTWAAIRQKLEQVFEVRQTEVLAEVVEAAYADLRQSLEGGVKTSDFNELKSTVRELAEAQTGSKQRLSRLEVTVAELAEAQKRTEEELRALTRVVGDVQETQKTIRDRQASMLGSLLETHYRERAGS